MSCPGDLCAALPRVDEIRAENHQGDVAARDIAWLCDVAAAAIDLADVWRGASLGLDDFGVRLARLRGAIDG